MTWFIRSFKNCFGVWNCDALFRKKKSTSFLMMILTPKINCIKAIPFYKSDVEINAWGYCFQSQQTPLIKWINKINCTLYGIFDANNWLNFILKAIWFGLFQTPTWNECNVSNWKMTSPMFLCLIQSIKLLKHHFEFSR